MIFNSIYNMLSLKYQQTVGGENMVSTSLNHIPRSSLDKATLEF